MVVIRADPLSRADTLGIVPCPPQSPAESSPVPTAAAEQGRCLIRGDFPPHEG